jgi:hypothetical protein
MVQNPNPTLNYHLGLMRSIGSKMVKNHGPAAKCLRERSKRLWVKHIKPIGFIRKIRSQSFARKSRANCKMFLGKIKMPKMKHKEPTGFFGYI